MLYFKTMSDIVDSSGFFVNLIELYQIAAGLKLLTCSYKKLCWNWNFCKQIKSEFFQQYLTQSLIVNKDLYRVDARNKIVHRQFIYQNAF